MQAVALVQSHAQRRIASRQRNDKDGDGHIDRIRLPGPAAGYDRYGHAGQQRHAEKQPHRFNPVRQAQPCRHRHGAQRGYGGCFPKQPGPPPAGAAPPGDGQPGAGQAPAGAGRKPVFGADRRPVGPRPGRPDGAKADDMHDGGRQQDPDQPADAGRDAAPFRQGVQAACRHQQRRQGDARRRQQQQGVIGDDGQPGQRPQRGGEGKQTRCRRQDVAGGQDAGDDQDAGQPDQVERPPQPRRGVGQPQPHNQRRRRHRDRRRCLPPVLPPPASAAPPYCSYGAGDQAPANGGCCPVLNRGRRPDCRRSRQGRCPDAVLHYAVHGAGGDYGAGGGDQAGSGLHPHPHPRSRSRIRVHICICICTRTGEAD